MQYTLEVPEDIETYCVADDDLLTCYDCSDDNGHMLGQMLRQMHGLTDSKRFPMLWYDCPHYCADHEEVKEITLKYYLEVVELDSKIIYKFKNADGVIVDERLVVKELKLKTYKLSMHPKK